MTQQSLPTTAPSPDGPPRPQSPDHRKPCTLCAQPRDVLVRCQIDSTRKWHLVCAGSCWRRVSGGVIDGDKLEEHRFYRYGGMWKNKHDAVSAKMKKGKKKKNRSKAIGNHQAERDSEPTDSSAANDLEGSSNSCFTK